MRDRVRYFSLHALRLVFLLLGLPQRFGIDGTRVNLRGILRCLCACVRIVLFRPVRTLLSVILLFLFLLCRIFASFISAVPVLSRRLFPRHELVIFATILVYGAGLLAAFVLLLAILLDRRDGVLGSVRLVVASTIFDIISARHDGRLFVVGPSAVTLRLAQCPRRGYTPWATS